MRSSVYALMVCTALSSWSSVSLAQTPEAPGATVPARTTRPKARPARIVTVVNDSPSTLTSLTLSGRSGAPVSLASPLPPARKATLNLSRLKGCSVAVSAQFEDAGSAETTRFDVCKDRLLRFTE